MAYCPGYGEVNGCAYSSVQLATLIRTLRNMAYCPGYGEVSGCAYSSVQLTS